MSFIVFLLFPRRPVHLVSDGIDRPPDVLQAPGLHPRQLVRHNVLSAETPQQRQLCHGAAITVLIQPQLKYLFYVSLILAPSGAQGVTMAVCHNPF